MTRRLALALSAACLGLVAGACGGGGPVAVSSGALGQGKLLFQQRCGSCHALADAGTQGTIGPNLDEAYAAARLDGFQSSSFASMVREQIEEAEPPMPRNLVTGADADAVSAYVAAVAGYSVAKAVKQAGTNAPSSTPPPGGQG